jgi:hypothetical protein
MLTEGLQAELKLERKAQIFGAIGQGAVNHKPISVLYPRVLYGETRPRQGISLAIGVSCRVPAHKLEGVPVALARWALSPSASGTPFLAAEIVLALFKKQGNEGNVVAAGAPGFEAFP